MTDAIYFSVNRPEQGKQTRIEYMVQMESVQSAILSFIHVFLGRRHLVWCGHPDVASQISFMAKDLGIDEKSWIKAYKPKAIMDQMSIDASVGGQKNIIVVDAKTNGSDPYFETRERLFSENEISHAVFIGGDEDTIEEYKQFKKYHKDAEVIPFSPSGGASVEISRLEGGGFDANLRKDQYIATFFKLLGIGFEEQRYNNPNEKNSMLPKFPSELGWQSNGGLARIEHLEAAKNF